MFMLMTERHLRPGTFDDFRRAWRPQEFPPPLVRAYHLRDTTDPDHVVSFGILDVDAEGLAALMGDPGMRRNQDERTAAMAPFLREVGLDGLFEVVEVVEGPAA